MPSSGSESQIATNSSNARIVLVRSCSRSLSLFSLPSPLQKKKHAHAHRTIFGKVYQRLFQLASMNSIFLLQDALYTTAVVPCFRLCPLPHCQVAASSCALFASERASAIPRGSFAARSRESFSTKCIITSSVQICYRLGTPLQGPGFCLQQRVSRVRAHPLTQPVHSRIQYIRTLSVHTVV